MIQKFDIQAMRAEQNAPLRSLFSAYYYFYYWKWQGSLCVI